MTDDKLAELRGRMVAQLRQARADRAELADQLRAKEREVDTLVGAIQGIDAAAKAVAGPPVKLVEEGQGDGQ